MFESRRKKLASRKVFYRRIAYSLMLSVVLMLFCLGMGTLGYHYWGEMSWINALHNAAMILSGMGLVDPVHTDMAKIFSSAYALFSGIIFITNLGIILAPAAHRLFHILHLEDN